MSRQEYKDQNFWITHTIEEDGPHPTIPHDHYDDSFCISIILEGGGTCYVEGIAYPLSAGTIMVISPDEIRYFQLSQSGRHERITLYFSRTIVTSLWGYEMPLLEGFISKPSLIGNWFTQEHYDVQNVQTIINQLHHTIKSEMTMKSPRLHLLILQLLFALYDSSKEAAILPPIQKQDLAVQEICAYIKTHINEELSHEFFQKHFFVSHHLLTKRFPQQTGMTLSKYITTKRLMQAASLIREGQRCEHAAFHAGFNSYCHFYKEFVKHFGMSPTKYFKCR